MDIRGKVALVTGSSTGIGRATALQLAEMGAKIIVNYARSKDDAGQTLAGVRERGAEGICVEADVTDESAVRAMLDEAGRALGPIEILVNNAGTSRFVAFDNLDGLTDDIWDETYRTNVVSAYRCIRLCVPSMRAAGWGRS